MNDKTIPFKMFIAKRLKSLNVKFLALSILLIFMATFYQSLNSNIESNIQSIVGISRYLDNLNSTNDRAELQKILKSVSDSHETQIKLVKDSYVFSSSEGLGELDQIFKKPSGLGFKNNIFGLDGFSVKIRKLNDGEIYIFSTWTPIVKNVLSSFVFLSISILVLLLAYFRKLRLLLNQSISPLSDLQQDINGLLVGKKLETEPQEILELEDIRLALLRVRPLSDVNYAAILKPT
jgi:hypothetical protein